MRRASKTDSNQRPIVQALRDIFGPDCVFDLSAVGQGCPDLMVGVRGVNLLIEIKTDKGKLTTDQVIFHKSWPGSVVVVRTLQEALDAIAKATT